MMVSNHSDGWVTLVNAIATELKISCCSFKISNLESVDAMNAFSCWKHGKEVRTVYAMKESRWVFYEKGEIQWFENPEFYGHKVIKKRLNKEILAIYCDRLGLPISEASFWHSNDSILLERVGW